MPAGSVDSLTSDVREGGGWVYYGIVSYTSGETAIRRTSTDGATTEDLATIGQYATFELSPNGRYLLMARVGGTPTIVVRDLVAAVQREIVVEGADFAKIGEIAWASDSEHIVMRVTSLAFSVDCRSGAEARREGATEDEVRANQRFWVIDPDERRVYRLPVDAESTADATLLPEG
jgi:hypothetical protein